MLCVCGNVVCPLVWKEGWACLLVGKSCISSLAQVAISIILYHQALYLCIQYLERERERERERGGGSGAIFESSVSFQRMKQTVNLAQM